MFPNRLKSALPALIAATLVSACGGGGGSASAMPENFQVVEGDSQVTITWKQEAGVQYWLFYAPSTTDITVESWKKTAGALSKIGDRGKGISSPYVITGLTNDKSYDFLLNGRTDGGEGGPTASLSPKTPRLSGNTWLTGKPLSSGTPLLSDKLMRSLAYGLTASGASTYSYVAVGHGGKIYKTPDIDGERSYGAIDATGSVLQPLNWTSPTGTQVSSGIDLKGIAYATGLAKYIAVGTAGSVAYSSDINNWTTLNSTTTGTSNTLNAVASNGASLVVAVGDNGTIRYSTDGTSWTAANAVTPATSANLYGVAYSAKGEWVAVGDGGTVLTSTDGSNWTASIQSGALKSVAAVTHVATNSVITYAFVAVGSDGTVLTRTDDNAWSAQTLPGSSFYAASAGSRLVAAGTNGTIFTCEIPCVSWTVPPTKPATAETIYGLLNAQNTYTAVGSNSLSIYSY